MVSEYLKKEKKKFDSIVKKNREEISKLDTKLIENEKFTALLESETQKVFRDFSPREIDGKNQKKLKELKEEREKLNSIKNKLSEELSAAKESAKNLREALSEVKELEMQAEDSKWYEENMYNAGDENGEPVDETLITGKAAERVREILKYLLSDPLRAKRNLEKMLGE